MMSETMENGVADSVETEVGGDVPAAKQHLAQPQDAVKKTNGIANHKEELSNDSLDDKDETTKEEQESDNSTDAHVNGSKDTVNEADENHEEPADKEPDKASEPQQEEENSNQSGSNNDQSKEGSEERSTPRPENDENSSSAEAMEVDKDEHKESGPVDESSNMSAAVSQSDVVEVKANDSMNPSIVSEDSSRDSVDTIDSKSGDSDDSPGFVGKINDGDGEDYLITLNDEDAGKETDEASKDGSSVKTDKESIEIKSDDSQSNSRESTQERQTSEKPSKETTPDPTLKPIISQPGGSGQNTPTSLAIQSGGQTFYIQGNASIPVGAQLVQQGSQLGYVTRIGAQNIFVPVTNLTAAASASPGTKPSPGTPITAQSHAQQQPKLPPINPEDLKPKSSLEMIELMKWEIQNRVPDNSNWSVAFHPKREELSSITSFLLELGHDVVKESVYKDIIQIQTKKKDAGELRDNEVESLEKMKTVYENTRKKVEQLQLPSNECNGCEFKTESDTVMNWHKDFPHYDPSWDTTHGSLKCAYCNFKTKQAAQFSFHMSAVHNVEAKLLDKLSCFQCELCPLNTTTKNKLDKHRQKCVKHFKLNVNLHPYYHDVNFCMKTCYYKPKRPPKPVPKPQPTPPVRPAIPATAQNLNARRVATPPPRMGTPTRNITPSPYAPKPPPLQQMKPLPGKSPGTPMRPGSVSQPRPGIATARGSVPPAPTPTRGAKPAGKEMAGFEVCELCGGYVKDRHALRIHFYYAHKVEMPQAIFNRIERPLSCEVCKSKFWTTQGLTKHKSTLRHYSTPSQQAEKPSPGSNQQCFMCNRKVANLFIHIENVHGMTMKDLVAMKKCIICGITAADRKSLESHMASAHGVLIKANEFMGQQEKPGSRGSTPQPAPPAKPGASLLAGVPVGKNSKPSIKQNLCVFCQLQFADNIQLTMHCIKNHATCNDCGMVVQSSKHLTNHNCRQVKRHCDICGMRDMSPDVYVEHVKKLHMKPCKVSVDKMSNDEIGEVKDKIKREYQPAIISLDSEEDSDLEVVDSEEKSNKTVEINDDAEEEDAVSVTSEGDASKSNKLSAENIDENSSESKDMKQDDESVKADVSESEGNEDVENSSGSRKRKADDEEEVVDDADVDNKRVKLDSDEAEHSDGDIVETSAAGEAAVEMEAEEEAEDEAKDETSEKAEAEGDASEKAEAEGDASEKGEAEDAAEGDASEKPEADEDGDSAEAGPGDEASDQNV